MDDVPTNSAGWYAAHCIMSLRVLEGVQEDFPVHENIIMIRARSPREAWERAQERAREDETDGVGTWFREDDRRPARWVFAGVRKVVECFEPQLGDGVEVSYSELVLDSEEDVRRLATGESVTLLNME